jgi:diguanylate cyclase (GGDEF)-like protein/hemerythrin-like metal-binding protein/PAS domain S-box-containing protein
MSSSPLIGANNATEGGVAIVEDITTRRVDEEALRQSETRLRLMLETSPIAVRIAGNAGHKVLFANQRYAQLIVSTPEATLGVDPSAYYADANAYQEILDVLAKGEHVTNRLIELRMRDGQTKWAWASYLMLDFENEPAVLGWFYDVTEQKKVEMALRESEAKLRDIAEYTYDWDYWLGPDGHLIYVSPSCERITGYRPEEFMAAPDLLHRIVHPEYQELLVSHLHGTEQKDACELEFVIINKKGEARWIAHGCRPIFDTEGRYLGRRSSNRDITANKEAEVEYRTIIQTMQDGFLLVGADTHFVDVNDAYCQMLGYTRDEVLGLAIADIEAVKDDTGVIRPTDEILLHGHAHFETRHRRKDGSAIDVELTASRLESRGGVLIALVRDISERKAAEAEIHQWAYFDRLTNLPNRRLLEDRLQQQVVRAKREHQRLSLLFVDLDKFKPINDKLGHDVGDWLLQAVAQRMQGCVRESDTVARMGGDEFVVLLPNVKVIEDAIGVAHKVRLALQEPFITLNDRKLEITSSIGVALYPDHADNLRDLLRCGDEAMYRAKRAGRNAVEVFPVDESTSGWESLPSAGDRPVVHLIWKSDYTCGEPTIDDEHREMFRLANALLDQALARNLDSDAVRKAFDALLNHVVKHFADEEAILAANGYPLLNEHAELHRQLVVHAKKLRQRTEEAGSSLGEIVEFLVSEVVSRHMLREDRKFAGLFSRGIGIVRSNASNGLTG